MSFARANSSSKGMEGKAYVGRKQFDSGKPHVGRFPFKCFHINARLIVSSGDAFEGSYICFATVHGKRCHNIRVPPSPSAALQSRPTSSQGLPNHQEIDRFSDVTRYFCILRQRLEPTLRLTSGCLLSYTCKQKLVLNTLIQLNFLITRNIPEPPDSRLPPWTSPKTVQRPELNHTDFSRAKLFRTSIKASLSQAMAIRTKFAGARYSDYRNAIDTLSKLSQSADEAVERIQDEMGRMHQTKSTMAAEAAIQESRNSLALTVVAVVFLPVSLASSVFGMDVQEINDSEQSIWHFVVTATIMLLLSALAWKCWRRWKKFLETELPAIREFLDKYRELLFLLPHDQTSLVGR